MKKLFLGLLAASMCASLHAADTTTTASDKDPVSVKESAPDRYTVVPGDTLWGIANRYLNDPWRWPQIWQANRQISNPHLIYPGDVLVLCHIEDRAVIAVDQGSGCAGIPGASPGLVSGDSGHITGSNGEYKVHPQIRSQPLSVAIPAIPLQLIEAFLNNSRVVDYDTLKKAPYVVAGGDGHLVTGAGDEVYARGETLGDGNSYGIFRSGVRYADPDTKEVLGYEATAIGDGKVTGMQAGVGILEISDTYNTEVRIQDLLLPHEEREVTTVFEPSNPDHVKPGRIIRVFDSIASAANYSVIVINRGGRDGVKQGDTFAVYQHGGLVRDQSNDDIVRLPSERDGMAMVFRTFDKVSYALVLRASNMIKVGDEVRPPISGD